MRKLNELEGVAIGIIHNRQPCTAYSMRMELKASPSSHWRASAGAIYPLLTRLESDGLITSTEDGDDGRGRKLLTITPQGKKALKAWIKDITNPDLISEISDPVRSRIFFLHTLTPLEQIRFAENTLKALENMLIDAHQYLKEQPSSSDLYLHLGAVGGIINTQSRIEFMKVVLKQLTENRKLN